MNFINSSGRALKQIFCLYSRKNGHVLFMPSLLILLTRIKCQAIKFFWGVWVSTFNEYSESFNEKIGFSFHALLPYCSSDRVCIQCLQPEYQIEYGILNEWRPNWAGIPLVTPRHVASSPLTAKLANNKSMFVWFNK